MSNHDSEEAPPDEARAALVHDLRTPLNAILAWAQVLTPGTDQADLRHGLEVIARSARTQARLLDLLVSGSPRAEFEEAAAQAAEMCPDLGGVSVLLVDDDDASRDGTAAILVAAGASVEVIGSAADALSALRRRRVDVVVSDISMPGMDGYELVAAMRADDTRRVRLTPAIALTALSSSRDRQRAFRAGFQLHLSKPVEAAELCLAVESVICRADGPRASGLRRGRRLP